MNSELRVQSWKNEVRQNKRTERHPQNQMRRVRDTFSRALFITLN
jgi:hypothetical protein